MLAHYLKYGKRLITAVKRYGLRHVMVSIAQKVYAPFFVDRAVLMFHIFKNASFKEYACPEHIVFSKLTDQDHEELLDFSPYMTKKELQERLAKEHHCFVAKDGDRIVFHTWVGKGRIYIPVIGKSIDLKTDQVYFYNTYTDNDYSSFNILPVFLTKMHDIYDQQQSPYTEALTIVDTEVKIPVRAYKRITGATKITLIQYHRVLWMKTHDTREITDKEASALCRKK